MDAGPSNSHRRKRNNPKKLVPITWPCSGARICPNSACSAVLSVFDPFCKRCSCCICKKYDGNKDPTLWLECSPDSPVRSCGSSFHITCALKEKKAGVANNCQMMRLDGGYWCFHCGHISGILGCLKRQLTIAKDSRRVAPLFDRIDLCVKLLDGTRRFQDLLETVEEVKRLLLSQVSSVDGSSSMMAPSLVCRLSAAAEIKELCTAALRRADELSATHSTASLGSEGPDLWMPDQMVSPGTSKAAGAQSTSHQLDLNMVAEPELDADVAPAHDSSMGNTDPGCDGSENWALQGPHEELPVVIFQAVMPKERLTSTEARGDLNAEAAPVSDASMENADLGCDGSVNWAQQGQGPNEAPPAVNVQAEVATVRPARPEVPGNLLDGNYEYCMGVIRGLEVDRHITSEDRQKLFTWISLWSDEHERKVVRTYITAFGSDLSALAEQLLDSFGGAMRNS